MNRAIAFRIVVLLVSFLPVAAYAERCWMVGCKGLIGFVFVPESQIDSAEGRRTWNFNGVVYSLDETGRLFEETSLPQVNSTVTLRSGAEILGPNQIRDQKILAIARASQYEIDKTQKIARVRSYIFEDMNMRSGTKLRVLGYEYVAVDSVSVPLLMALVQVVHDG